MRILYFLRFPTDGDSSRCMSALSSRIIVRRCPTTFPVLFLKREENKQVRNFINLIKHHFYPNIINSFNLKSAFDMWHISVFCFRRSCELIHVVVLVSRQPSLQSLIKGPWLADSLSGGTPVYIIHILSNGFKTNQ